MCITSQSQKKMESYSYYYTVMQKVFNQYNFTFHTKNICLHNLEKQVLDIVIASITQINYSFSCSDFLCQEKR